MKVFVNYNDPRWKSYKIDFQGIAQSVNKNKNAEVSITLTNDREIKRLNRKYRGKDTPTNVLSFEMDDSELLGDIFISIDTVLREAKSDNKTFEDHTAHLVVHGVLHLMGFDHMNDSEANKMENLEIKILKYLGIENPYSENKKWFSKIYKNRFFRSLILLLSGGMAAFGFAPFGFWWATIIGIGVSYYLTVYNLDNNKNNKFWSAFFYILPFSAAYAIGQFWWVLNSIYVVPELAKQFAIWTIPGLVGIGIVGGFIFAIPFIAIRCMRQNGAHRPFLFAAVWTFVLWLREWFLTGFPWNPVANITINYPVISNSMSLFGALGLTFIIIGLISSIVEIIKNKNANRIFIPLMVFKVLIITGIFFGYKNIEKSEIKNYESAPVIRIVQPGKSAIEKATYSREQEIENADNNIKNLITLAQTNNKKVDMVIFPETTYPYLIVNENLPIAKTLGVKTIIGATSYDYGKFYNSLLVVNLDGKIEKLYSKSHLVPFGEYRVFGDLIPTPGQLTPGRGPEIIQTKVNGKDFYFAPAICYEIIFSDSLVSKNAVHQPQVIINITNDNWFGKTPGTYQHLDMVRRYAIESGLPIVRSNYSGISAFIDADGTVVSYLPIGAAGSLDGIPTGHHYTIYREIGRDWWMIIILSFSIFCLVSISGFQKKD